jgi:cytochrome c peroxidase
MELSPESGIVGVSDEAIGFIADGHDLEQATPDVRAPSHSWSLVFWDGRHTSTGTQANGPGLHPGHCLQFV